MQWPSSSSFIFHIYFTYRHTDIDIYVYILSLYICTIIITVYVMFYDYLPSTSAFVPGASPSSHGGPRPDAGHGEGDGAALRGLRRSVRGLGLRPPGGSEERGDRGVGGGGEVIGCIRCFERLLSLRKTYNYI